MPGIIGVLLAAAAAAAFMLLYVEKRRNLELAGNLKDTEEALLVLRNIKHRQNNMFQSIIFYLECEQWDEAREFIDEIMIETCEFNKNNLLQLIKIKSCKLRSTISKIMAECGKNAISLVVIVTWEDVYSDMREKEACRLILLSFTNVMRQLSGSSERQMTIEICSGRQGFSALISSTCDVEPFIKIQNGLSKNFIFNSYMENNCFRQEIMISKNV
jgi:hypothetical protein